MIEGVDQADAGGAGGVVLEVVRLEFLEVEVIATVRRRAGLWPVTILSIAPPMSA
jgi:hypothetical protein